MATRCISNKVRLGIVVAISGLVGISLFEVSFPHLIFLRALHAVNLAMDSAVLYLQGRFVSAALERGDVKGLRTLLSRMDSSAATEVLVQTSAGWPHLDGAIQRTVTDELEKRAFQIRTFGCSSCDPTFLAYYDVFLWFSFKKADRNYLARQRCGCDRRLIALTVTRLAASYRKEADPAVLEALLSIKASLGPGELQEFTAGEIESLRKMP